MTEARRPSTSDPNRDDPNGISAARYRSTMRHFPAGVTVVTLRSSGNPVGFTATSFASLSLQPPLVSFNIADTSSSLAALLEAESVVIHFLGAHQHHVAHRFSRTAQHRFADDSLWTSLPTGEPVLHDTPAWLRVTIHRLIPVGDHTIVIGLVTRVHDEGAPHPDPLLYYDGRYHRPTPITD